MMTYANKEKQIMNSVARRFNRAMILVVSFVLFCFAAAAILYTIHQAERDLEQKLSNSVNIAKTSLGQAFWNLNDTIINDFISAVFLDKTLAYVGVDWGGQVVVERRRGTAKHLSLKEIQASRNLIVRTAEIEFQGKPVGNFVVAASRDSIYDKIFASALAILALAAAVLISVWLTTLFVSRNFIAKPLQALRESVRTPEQ